MTYNLVQRVAVLTLLSPPREDRSVRGLIKDCGEEVVRARLIEVGLLLRETQLEVVVDENKQEYLLVTAIGREMLALYTKS
jgi:hypothetical protein